MKNRNYGIDALRIVAMFQIVVIHSLNQGGILSACNDNIVMSRTAWFVEVLFFSSVNIYALISGYVGTNTEFKVSRIINFWLQVFFYTFFITLFFQIIFPERINLKIWFKALFPIISRQYWYISCYFLLMLFIPLLNCGIKNISIALHRFIVCFMVLICSVLPILTKFYPINFDAGTDSYGMLGGYSTIWLMMLYVTGAYISRSQIIQKVKSWVLIVIILLCTCVTWESLFFMPQWTIKRFGEIRYETLLLDYVSPTIVVIAICMLVLFSRINVKNNKLAKGIYIGGKTSLSVYLIHTNPLIWDGFIKDYTKTYVCESAIMMVLKLFGASMLIYIACTLVDLVRMLIFKLLRLDSHIDNLVDKLIGKRIGLRNEK